MEKNLSDYNLLRMALAAGILGVGILIVMSLLTPEMEFLDYYNAEGKVRLEGEIVSVNDKGNYTFMKARYDCVVDTVVFDSIMSVNNPDANNTLVNGTRIIVEGNIQEYKGKKSVVADKIEIVSG